MSIPYFYQKLEMVVRIKKGESKASIDRKLKKLYAGKKGFPAYKYLGKIKIEEGPMEIQKRLRDEWSERSR